MLERLRQSLALRLAVQYTLVFALASALLFSALYWVLADAIEARERDSLAVRAEIFSGAYNLGGLPLLERQIKLSRDPQPYFVRFVNPDNSFVWVGAPPEWIETQIERIPIGPLFFEKETKTVRMPSRDASREYVTAQHVLADGRILQVGRLTDSRAVLLAPLRRAFGRVGAGAFVVSLVVGTLLSWRATRPLRQVSATARRIIETGDLSARVPGEEGRGELAVLVQQINALLDKNTNHVRVLRETLDNIAHDLRTPLTRLRGTAELALQDGGDPVEARSALADCVDESDRVLHLLEALLDISAAEAGALKLDRDRTDLRSITERAADLYREVADDKKITVSLEQSQPVDVDVDNVRFGQAVNNLLDNALKYTPAGGRVTIAVYNEPKAGVITVTDNGPGIPLAEREAIFRRLYRGDASRSQRGLGLGLSMVKAIVEAHGGSVSVDDAPGGGARFTLRLPR